MKNPELLVGKYYVVTLNGNLIYFYTFPGEEKSRLRTDDMEMVYWTEYSKLLCISSPQYSALKVYENIGDSISDLMKKGHYNKIKKIDWLRKCVEIIFSNNFDKESKEIQMFLDKLSKIS